jgi:hypothetical protein
MVNEGIGMEKQSFSGYSAAGVVRTMRTPERAAGECAEGPQARVRFCDAR